MGRGRRAERRASQRALHLRKCVGCRIARPRAELLRLGMQAGEVAPDEAHALPGRGCSLCRKASCAERAVKGRQISRALKGKVKDPTLDALLGWLEAAPTSVA